MTRPCTRPTGRRRCRATTAYRSCRKTGCWCGRHCLSRSNTSAEERADGRKSSNRWPYSVEQLALHNADTVFGVPGESYLAALDGMYQSQRVRFINARHEGGAAMMAEAHGKLTGRPGIAFATRGPGATNASAGVHVAFQDSTPMILLLGQVGRDMMEREAFQEIDYRQMFGPMSKWVAQIDDARRIPDSSRALFTRPRRGVPARSCWRCPRTCSPTPPRCRMRRPTHRFRSRPTRAPCRNSMRFSPRRRSRS